MDKKFDIEQVLVAVALLIVVFAAAFDYQDDWSQGATWIDLIFDSLLNVFVAGTLLYILLQRPRATRLRNRYLEQAVRHSTEDMERWRSKAAELLRGLGKQIDDQLDHWRLSRAEKEVALLLIKGLSLKEVATMRGTNEKTVRQQASQVYAKARLENRAELAAFFLEDLLLPERT